MLALGHDHRAGGVGVEAVNDALALGRAAGGDRVSGAEQARRCTVCAGPAGGRVGGDADGLVDHDDVVVLVQDRHAGHRLGHRHRRRRAAAAASPPARRPPCTRSDLAAGRPSTSTSPADDELGRAGCGRARTAARARRRGARLPARRGPGGCDARPSAFGVRPRAVARPLVFVAVPAGGSSLRGRFVVSMLTVPSI